MTTRDRSRGQFVNGKWLAQAASGTQRYATQVMLAVRRSATAGRPTLVVPADAVLPDWTDDFPVLRSRLRGMLFEQLALPWLTRAGHLYSLAGPAPLVKRDQTVVMHDATPFRHPETFRRAFVLWYQLLYRVLARRASRVLTVSEFSRSELSAVLGVPTTRFGLAPCGADHVAEDSGPPPDWLPFEPGSFALLVGNQAPHKNVAPALAALTEAGVRVAVVGGQQRQVFRSAAVEAGEGVALLGRVDDDALEQLYAAAGVLVAPSRYEGFGIPVVEAGRLGCPSVVATGSALTEVAGAGARSFDPDDMTGCADLVSKLLHDPVARDELAGFARENARRFTWAATAEALFAEPGRGAVPLPEDERRIRVLHVTEAFAAGTGMAMVGFARSTRESVESHLLVQDRGSGLLDELGADSPFVTAQLLPAGARSLVRGLRRALAEIRPDVVHVHSSIAGGVVRLWLARASVPVVYSPHCFAFERRDIPVAKRWAFHTAEKRLARLTDGFACVSPYEADLARSLGGSARVEHLVNAFEPVAKVPGPPAPSADGPLRIVSVGRVVPQKAPDVFARVIEELRARGVAVDATWVGGGEDEAGWAALRRAGVEVTGWLPSRSVLPVLASQSVYLHTASWEAGPIAVFEAMRAQLVVVVRRTPAYRDMLPEEFMVDDVDGAVEMILQLGHPEARAARLRDQHEALRALADRGPQAVLPRFYRDVRQQER
ncbi:glycosyltransferase [Modestobacter versicolor]|uniref:glycosyltransferase n=1 Tax=Modestobacter versicolor TaxID=429133 RepID=UPI0034E03567